MPKPSKTADPQTAEQIAAAEQAKAAEQAAILNLMGDFKYAHETGTIKLYDDKRRAGVKNGRAGHVVLMPRPSVQISCSVYMDVTTITENGKSATKRDYRFSFPKSVSGVFASKAEESKFKFLHLTAWLKARTEKASTSDASGDDASISEIESDDE